MNIAFNLLIVGVVIVWIALVFWTWADARRRITDRFLVGCATVGALFPFVGSLVYLIVRPPELLEDVRERELEIAASEATLANVKASACPHCDGRVESDFLRCPSCLRKLRESCPSCSRPLEAEWRICPYCEADPAKAVAAPPAAKPRRRRATASDTAAGSAASAAAAGDGKAAVDAEAGSKRRTTTKAAAKRSTRRREPAQADADGSDKASSAGAAATDGPAAKDRDGSPEPEPTA